MMNLLINITARHWLKLGLFNLLLVATLGWVMRLKVLLPLPAINQKFLLHAHSHFAFSGWVSHTLMVLVALLIFNRKPHEKIPRRYQLTLLLNLLAAYGMLIGFILQGYGRYSIMASSLSVVASYMFAGICWRDLSKMRLASVAHHWLRAALVFLVLSSLGTFSLAYLMASHNTDSRLQLASVYFYLHFQYNGWFFFACMALIQHWLQQQSIHIKHAKAIFWLFVLACPVNYLLSILWWDMPGWLYMLLVIAVLMQSGAWIRWLSSVIANQRQIATHLSVLAKWLFMGVVVAATIKFMLQGLSVIPALSKLSYSFRPIVIGYLHLVLLAVISLFIIAYGYVYGLLRVNRTAVWSTTLFVAGVIFNELLLMVQGISGLAHLPIAPVPMLLTVAAGTLVLGIVGLLFSQRK